MVVSGSNTAICRARVLGATFDLPPKAKVLKFTQFNRRFGCTVCKVVGMVVRVCRGTTRVYPYAEPLTELRRHKKCYEMGKCQSCNQSTDSSSSALVILSKGNGPIQQCLLQINPKQKTKSSCSAGPAVNVRSPRASTAYHTGFTTTQAGTASEQTATFVSHTRCSYMRCPHVSLNLDSNIFCTDSALQKSLMYCIKLERVPQKSTKPCHISSYKKGKV